MRRFYILMSMIVALSISSAAYSVAEEIPVKPKFMGFVKGCSMETYPHAKVVKRFLIANSAYSNKKRTVGDENTVQKMSEKVLNDFMTKGAARCNSSYYVIEEIATELAYHPNGSLLLHLDANVVCFNSDSPL